jgi:hypothetical protein
MCSNISTDEGVHVAGDDAEVAESPPPRFAVDELLLRARIRDAGDARRGKSLGQIERQRAPAASELQDLLAVREPPALDIEGEHGELGGVERLAAGGEEAAGVFQPPAQAELVEAGGHLVVLLVRGGRRLRQRPALQILRVGGEAGLRFRRGCGGLIAKALGQEAANPKAEEPVREEVSFEQGVDHARGHHGTKALVRA